MTAAAAVAKTLKVAIIGSGPSAFYSAARLLSSASTSSDNVEVHMYERLPTPHGLVRYGVAPDHPEVKNVENKFAQVAGDPRFHFFGNVNVVDKVDAHADTGMYDYPLATHLPLNDVLPHYTHVLLSYGCSLARTLGVAGSEPGALGHVHSALDVVNWYNGHPAAHDAAFLAREPWRRVSLSDAHVRHATVVGAGNVALDVARILLRARTTLHDLFTADSSLKARAALRETDVPEPVLAALSQCSIDAVEIVARRGPAQVAFTNKELREMMELQDVTFQPPLPEHMALAREQVAALEAMAKTSPEAASEARVRKRLLSIVEKGSATRDGKVRWAMDFFKAPHALLARDSGAAADVGGIRWNHMAFDPVPSIDDRQQPWSGGAPRPQSAKNQMMLRHTGEQVDSKTDMVIASVGYKAAPLEGGNADGSVVPWDARGGVVPNHGGQVLDSTGKHIPGMYVSGWLARGPVGVIASTRIDANSVVEQMLHDWHAAPAGRARLSSQPPAPGAPEALRMSTRKAVSWGDWLRLDAEEVRRGQALGKLREKVLSVEEMLDFIG